MISNDMVHEFELMIPDVMNKSWKLHTDNIIRYFANSVKIEDTRNVLDTILDSIEKVGIEIETVHDIFWWMSFNWSYDFDLYSHLGFWKLTEDTDTKLFLEENYFPWLNTKGFQDYIVNPNNKKIGDTIESCKYPLKEYIYDFNKDTEYYKHKVHKDSLTMNTDFKSICCAVDEKYNIYYRNFIK
jgi:hypothetical protein